MSRSYKKHPVVTAKKQKFFKKLANKRVRRKLKDPEVELKNKDYRKDTESWEICDYKLFYSWDAYWQFCVERWTMFDAPRGIPFPDKEKEYKKWRKWYKRK